MDLIQLLITLLVVCGGIVGGFWVVGKMGLAPPWATFALIFWGVISLIVIIYVIFGLGGVGGGILHTKVIGSLETVRALS